MSVATVRTWRVYPDVLPQRGRTVARDGAVLVCLIVLAWLAIRVHDDIAGLDRLGVGVGVGSSVHRGFGAAADAVGGVPIVGGQLSESLRAAGGATGGAAVSSARHADGVIGRAAALIGWLIFLLPAVVLLGRYVPGPVRQMSQMTAAARVLIDSGDGAQRRLMAERSAFFAALSALLRHTRQPLTDLAEGHFQPLITRSSRTPGSADVRVNRQSDDVDRRRDHRGWSALPQRAAQQLFINKVRKES